MNLIKFEPAGCARIRTLLDAYLSNELAVETVQDVLSHMERCDECSKTLDERQRIKSALKASGRRITAPESLRDGIRASLRRDVPAARGWRGQQTWAAAAAVVLLFTAGTAVLVNRLGANSGARTSGLASPGGADAPVLKVGYDDHVHCTSVRPLPASPPSQADVERDLGSAHGELFSVMAGHVPAGYDLADAHHCSFGGRTFVHVLYRKDGQLLSIVTTARNGESFARTGALDVVEASGVELRRARLDNIQVDGFETEKYLVFVVSGLSPEVNLAVVASIARPVSDFLDNRSARAL